MKLARQRHGLSPCGSGLAWRTAPVLALLSPLWLPGPAAAQQGVWKPTIHDSAPAPTAKPAKPAAKPKVRPAAATSARAAGSAKRSSSSTSQSIVVLVNDEPITGYEIDQRISLAVMGSPELSKRLQAKLKSPNINDKFKAFAIKRLKANPPKTEAEQQSRVKQLQGQFVASIRKEVMKDFRPVARKKALDELIEERIKLQEAKRLNVVAGKAEVDRILKGMAERNKMTLDEFTKHVGKMGADVSAMRQRIKASLSWADVIRRRFGHQISLLGHDLNFVSVGDGQDDVELRVSRILLPVSTSANQKRIAQRLSDAERMRGGFSTCETMAGLAGGVADARFDDLGARKPATIPEPTRSLLLNARDGEMLPPTLGEGGVELWAVCGRKAVKPSDEKREAAKEDVRQKEFQILSMKHLKDLRQDAHIEYR